MKYSRGALLRWDEVAPGSAVRLRPHRQVELAHSTLLLSSDAPGWAVIPRDQLVALEQLDGSTIADLSTRHGNQVQQTLGQLYQAGLLAIDGRTGLQGNTEFDLAVKQEAPADRAPHQSYANAGEDIPLPNTLLIKLTGACNWACTYCYDFDRHRFRENLCLEDVAETISQIIAHHHQISIMFHGGEPLLRYSELRRIVEFANSRCREFGGRARFSMQTNGALITEDIVGFLDEHSFDIGISIDGPPDINDLTRVDHRGRGTTHILEELFAHQYDFMSRRVGFITTVTSVNVDHLDRVATYLRDLGVRSWKTAIFDTEGRGKASPELRPSVDSYIRFLTQWLSECNEGLWDGFRFKSILELIDTIASPQRHNMCLKFPCGAGRELIVASADRKLMACDATYDPVFVLGDTSDKLRSAQTSPNAHALNEREEWLVTEAECATCPWLHFCAGTCMAKALIQHGTVKAVDDFDCAVRKAIFPLLFERLAEPSSRLRAYYMKSRPNGRAESA